jgi:hypothetical protein
MKLIADRYYRLTWKTVSIFPNTQSIGLVRYLGEINRGYYQRFEYPNGDLENVKRTDLEDMHIMYDLYHSVKGRVKR